MLYLIKESSDRLLTHISEDPVRPHIPATARLGANRRAEAPEAINQGPNEEHPEGW